MYCIISKMSYVEKTTKKDTITKRAKTYFKITKKEICSKILLYLDLESFKMAYRVWCAARGIRPIERRKKMPLKNVGRDVLGEDICTVRYS